MFHYEYIEIPEHTEMLAHTGIYRNSKHTYIFISHHKK